MTLRDDHGELPAHAENLLRHLETLGRKLDWGNGPMHVQHMYHAQRSEVLAEHLRGVIGLASAGHYAAALALSRTALEHHLVDRLVLLATRWIAVQDGFKAKDVSQEAARLAALKASSRPDIQRWWYEPSNGTMNVLYRGIFREGSLGRGMTLSRYYFRLDRYDPFTVHKSVSGKVATPFQDPKAMEKWAAESAEQWNRHFRYRNLRKNLDINWLLRPRLGVQVDVHYAFLSAYVHGAKKAHELIYGHNIPNRLGDLDHFASELSLLYVIVIAAAELEVFGRMARREPRVGLVDWRTVTSEVAAARAATSYFWFLSGEPHMYDRIEEVHSRIPMPPSKIPARRLVHPTNLDPRRVRYYANPLVRLVKLHHTSQEWATGLVFVSPFDRPDLRRW
jgi:hypothetical protein